MKLDIQLDARPDQAATRARELLEAEVSRIAEQNRKRGGQAAGAREAEAEIFRRIDRSIKKQTNL